MLFDILDGNFSFSQALVTIIASLAVILVTLSVHEWAHGFVATRLGDPTPRYQGRLTLNPMAHIDWFGAAALLLFGIGWAKPVQVNPANFKNSKWSMAAVALAGPTSNVILSFIALFVGYLLSFISIVIGLESAVFNFFVSIFYSMAYTSVYLAIFNFIPIPPFDGSRILFALLPERYYFKVMQYERYIFIALLVLLYTGFLSAPIDNITNLLFDGINTVAVLPFQYILGLIYGGA